MKCPYCDPEMEVGVIQNDHEICRQKKKRFINHSRLYDDAVCLAPFSFLRGSAVTAFLCRGCRKVIIDYSE